MILTNKSLRDINTIEQLIKALDKESEALKDRLVSEKDDVRFYQGSAFFCQSLLKALTHKRSLV